MFVMKREIKMAPDYDTLIHFIGQQAIRGVWTSNTAQSYLSSVSRVLECSDDDEKKNVLNIVLADLFQRFREKNSALGENTMESYEGRVSAAIKSFRGAHESWLRSGQSEPLQAAGTLSIPLRAGTVRIDGLPGDLTQVEAKRIAGVVMAMAV